MRSDQLLGLQEEDSIIQVPNGAVTEWLAAVASWVWIATVSFKGFRDQQIRVFLEITFADDDADGPECRHCREAVQ
jgi:hypothetical protein